MKTIDHEVERIDRALRNDDRCRALAAGLKQLNSEELDRLGRHFDDFGGLVLDEVHYDAKSGLWCPLAIGLRVPARIAAEGTEIVGERRARDIISSVGKERDSAFTLNPIHGIRGHFYTERRYSDLRALVYYLRFHK
jgi:hypothetical protein